MADPATAKLRDIDFDAFGLSDEGKALMRGSMTPKEFVGALQDKERYEDAFLFLAHWLPKQAAIWWGVLCAWHRYRPTPPKKVAAALEAIIQWVQEPSEARRRAAAEAGEAAGGDTPAGMLATAVFYSGGSISLPKLPAVAAPPAVTPGCVSNALVMAAAQVPAAEQTAAKHQFIQIALDVSEGKNLWLAESPQPAVQR